MTKENQLAFLKRKFPQYEIRYTDDFGGAVMINPCSAENLKVEYYEDHMPDPICIIFSFQHCHFEHEEDAEKWIDELIKGRTKIIEFFSKGRSVFGGSIDSKELEDLSYDKLMEITGYVGITELLYIADSFKVRGWNGNENFDGEFFRDRDGKISIRYEYVSST